MAQRFHSQARAISVGAVAALALSASSAQAVPSERTEVTTPSVSEVAGGNTEDTGLAVAGAEGVDEAARTDVLGAGWAASTDVLWQLEPTPEGLLIIAGRESDGYALAPLARLSLPGIEATSWVGNACLVAGSRTLAAVFAPAQYVNDELLSQRGGYTALVDLDTGAVTYPSLRSSLSYSSPGCGSGDATFIQEEEGGLRTDVWRVAAVDGSATLAVSVPSQLTTPVMVGETLVAAGDTGLESYDTSGSLVASVALGSRPFDIRVDAQAGVVTLRADGSQTVVEAASVGVDEGVVEEIARGELGSVGLAQDGANEVYLTGSVTSAPGADVGVEVIPGSNVDAEVSSDGGVVVEAAAAEEAAADQGNTDGLADGRALTARSLDTGMAWEVTVPPDVFASGPGASTAAAAPATPGAGATAAIPATHASATCAAPRNDPRTQVYQPTPRQVEWAVDQAVRGTLTVERNADWKSAGLPAYTPQGMFPRTALAGGGVIPAQVMLGVMQAESNLQQASWHAIPGVTGNPLVGDYYGDSKTGGDFDIDYAQADCGYGVGQITDGMRKSDATTADQRTKQRAIAVDFAANIARSQQILAEKWNQVHAAEMTLNNGGPRYLENWFYALWAYNSGFYPEGAAGQPWGLGWFNNPANPRYPVDRAAFKPPLADHGRYPSRWPYPERVLGYAAWPVSIPQGPGDVVPAFRAAWWTDDVAKDTVKPPRDLFCNPTNECNIALCEPMPSFR